MDLPGDIGPDGHPRQDAHAMQDRGVLGPRSQANDGEVQQNRLRNRLRKKLQEIRTGFERAPVPPPDEVFRHLYYHVEPPWIRSLQSRHLQMIAIGGAIGIGLFIGTGTALHQGGPLSLFFGFLYIGVDLIFTVHALGEMAVMFPISGGFVTFSSRFINHAWGFAVGWK
jgi:amino acid permease